MWAHILALAGLVLVAGEHDGDHFDLIAGYIPGSDVVPHSRVDLDQQAMEAALAEAVPDFATAKQWYSVGGNSIKSGNTNRTIKGFSTGAQGKMYDNCPGCPYKTYEAFYGYYGDFDYADRLVSAALDGADMAFASGRHGPNNFASLGPAARIEAAKKGSAYMNVWMYVIREFEDAIDDCTSCTGDNCNEFSLNGGSVHAWDEGVAFYAGSLEGASGSPSGKLVWRLAEKRCANFGTCGLNGGETSGTSQINHLLLAQFQEGERLLQTGQCDRVRPVVDEIISLMTVPLVQGSLRYAYKIGEQPEERSQKNAAEGAIFTAAVLPLVHECDAAAAATISADMKFGLFDQGDLPDFQAVKAAFESTYACLGITCEHVGGLVDADGDPLHAMTAPCDDGPAFPLIAGYIPGSDVVPHSRVDLDQQAMEAALAEAVPDFATAKQWYSVGGNSIKSGNTNRTIKGFSTGAHRSTNIKPQIDSCPLDVPFAVQMGCAKPRSFDVQTRSMKSARRRTATAGGTRQGSL